MPRGGVSFDRVAHLYDRTRQLPACQMEPVLKALQAEFAGDEWVLEIGVGTGRFGTPLQERGIRLVGVDISPLMLADGRRKGLQDVLLADALALPFREASVDAVLMVHVLHLIERWREALLEVYRVARRAYYTVATYWEESRNPYDAYHEFVESAGHDPRAPGMSERKLPDAIAPSKRLEIGTFLEERRVEAAIQSLAERAFSGQWSVPEEIHRDAVEAVREEFSGEATLRYRKRIEVLKWDVAELVRD